MSDTLEPLIRDLVERVAGEPRPYSEALEAWRHVLPTPHGGRMRLIVALLSAGQSKAVESL